MAANEANSFKESYMSNLYSEFATRKELIIIDEKVDELIKSGAMMAVAIEGLTKSVDKISEGLATSVDKISESIRVLMDKKSFDAGARMFGFKCLYFTGSIVSVIMTAHWAGILNFLFKWATK